MKKTSIILLAFCLLFAFTAYTVLADSEAEKYSSIKISEEVKSALSKEIPFDNADNILKIYNVAPWYLDTFADGGDVIDILKDDSLVSQEIYFLRSDIYPDETLIYHMTDGEINRIINSGYDRFLWAPSVLESKKAINIEKKEEKIEDIYCLWAIPSHGILTVVYETSDSTYFLVYSEGVKEEPHLMDEENYREYCKKVVEIRNSRPVYDKDGHPIVGGIDPYPIEGKNVNTLDYSFESRNNTWIFIALGLFAAATLTAVILLVRKSKQKNSNVEQII